MVLVKFLVNNKVDSCINKLHIQLAVLLKVNNMPVSHIQFNIQFSQYECILVEPQQGFEQQGQQGNSFVQNVQYQTMPQYGVSG
jgi:hypothetical protein